jgi:hypothetical protein
VTCSSSGSAGEDVVVDLLVEELKVRHVDRLDVRPVDPPLLVVARHPGVKQRYRLAVVDASFERFGFDRVDVRVRGRKVHLVCVHVHPLIMREGT